MSIAMSPPSRRSREHERPEGDEHDLDVERDEEQRVEIERQPEASARVAERVDAGLVRQALVAVALGPVREEPGRPDRDEHEREAGEREAEDVPERCRQRVSSFGLPRCAPVGARAGTREEAFRSAPQWYRSVPEPPHADGARPSRGRMARWMAPEAPRTTAYVGLGANLGDAPATLAAGLASLAAMPGARLAGVSRLYRTRPVGVVDQPDFHNAAAALEVPVRARPRERRAGPPRRAEGDRARVRASAARALGATRARPRPAALRVGAPAGRASAGPRGLDVSPEGVDWLEVPHPAARERLFVLAPLADLAPGLMPPGWDGDVATMARRAAAAEGPGAVVAVATWDPVAAPGAERT